MFENFLMKSMLKSKMKGIPEEQQEYFLNLIEKNPDFFIKIAKEIQNKIKEGISQENAVITVMKNYETELKDLVKKV